MGLFSVFKMLPRYISLWKPIDHYSFPVFFLFRLWEEGHHKGYTHFFLYFLFFYLLQINNFKLEFFWTLLHIAFILLDVMIDFGYSYYAFCCCVRKWCWCSEYLSTVVFTFSEKVSFHRSFCFMFWNTRIMKLRTKKVISCVLSTSKNHLIRAKGNF